jgi:hypothetical protein
VLMDLHHEFENLIAAFSVPGPAGRHALQIDAVPCQDDVVRAFACETRSLHGNLHNAR